MESFWTKYISEVGNIRAVSIEGTSLMHGLCAQQSLEGFGQLGYGEAVLGALLIASTHKSSESINLNAKGSGRFLHTLIDASPEGRVRGFLTERKETPLQTIDPDGLTGPWGSGILSVLFTKNDEGKIPYTGMVELITGWLDDAINDYYRESEQLVSIVGIRVEFSGTKILSARGALIQALGGANEEEHALIRALNVKDLRELAQFANRPEEFRRRLAASLPGKTFKSVEEKPVTAFCTCSMERIERALILSGEADILEALGSDPFMTITCDFCRTEYKIVAERVRLLFKPGAPRLQ